MITLAFDLYGTLINPLGITGALQPVAGKQAPAFAVMWREKQLEYTYRRALMADYRAFRQCVAEAFQYTAERLQLEINPEQAEAMLALYQQLPAYADAAGCLQSLDRKHFRPYLLSNGGLDDIQQLLACNRLEDMLDAIVTVESVRTFKPDPAVYQHFLAVTESAPENTWLISSNPFDVIGAAHVGLHTAWIQRDSSNVFDPWEYRPNLVLNGLQSLAGEILQYRH